MIEVTPSTLMDFIKLIIECGGVYEVQSDYTVKKRNDNATVMIPNGKTSRPLMIFHENATINQDVAWLNPFKETLGVSREREWFLNFIAQVGGMFTKAIMLKLISDSVNKHDENYDQFKLMSKINDKVDKTMIEEVEKLSHHVFTSVYYNKREKTAEAQTELFDSELREAFPKFRKKTWEVIETIFIELFGSNDLSEYKYRAKLLDLPETEAKLTVAIALITAIGPLCRDILQRDLCEVELNQHLELLEGYSKIYAYANMATETSSKQLAMSQQAAPWQQQAVPPYGVAPQQTGYFMQPQPAYQPVMYQQQQQPIDLGTYGQPNELPPVASAENSIPMSRYSGLGTPAVYEANQPIYNPIGGMVPNNGPVFR